MDRRLVHVVAVAREGSFTLAAKQCGVTQSAVTKSIGDLEHEVGFLVFNRTARGTVLTEEGRGFVERAARLLDDARELMRGRSGSQDSYADVLHVGVCPASLDWKLAEPVALLLRRFPEVRLELSGGSFEHMVQQLRMGNVDVAIGFAAAFEEHFDLRCESLPAMRITPFVRHGHPLLDQGPAAITDLGRFPWVCPSDSRPHGIVVRQLYGTRGVDARQAIHAVDSFSVTQRMIATSDAVGFAALGFTQSAAFDRLFARVPCLEAFPDLPLCLAVRARWERRPSVRAFMQACRETITADEERDSPETTRHSRGA